MHSNASVANIWSRAGAHINQASQRTDGRSERTGAGNQTREYDQTRACVSCVYRKDIYCNAEHVPVRSLRRHHLPSAGKQTRAHNRRQNHKTKANTHASLTNMSNSTRIGQHGITHLNLSQGIGSSTGRQQEVSVPAGWAQSLSRTPAQ
jgi:hypothetical protein